MDYLVAAPGENLVIVSADNVKSARASAREVLGFQKLPKETEVIVFTESNYDRMWTAIYG